MTNSDPRFSADIVELGAQALADDVWHPPVKLEQMARHEANKFRRQARLVIEAASSSDGEPSNGKQPLMASRPAPPVPSDHTFDPAQSAQVRNATIEECARITTAPFGLAYTSQRHKEVAKDVADQIGRAIRALAAQPPAAPVDTDWFDECAKQAGKAFRYWLALEKAEERFRGLDYLDFANEIRAAMADPPEPMPVPSSSAGTEDAPEGATHMRRPEYITAWHYLLTERWPSWLVEKYTNTEAVPETMIGRYATAIDGEFWRWFDAEEFERMFVVLNVPQAVRVTTPSAPDASAPARRLPE